MTKAKSVGHYWDSQADCPVASAPGCGGTHGALENPSFAVVLEGGSSHRKELRMYAAMRRYEGVTDPSEAGRRVDEGFVPIVSSVPGFVAYYWVDAGGGVMVSTGVFENPAGAEESSRRAADWVKDNLASLLPTPPLTTTGEVVAHHVK